LELSYFMVTGSLSGLLSVLMHSVIRSAVETIYPPARDAESRLPVSEALLHMLCGAGLGLLFWLSWGLAAIVTVPWWVRGLSFGVLCWIAFSVPVILGFARASGLSLRSTALLATRWGTTCLIAALACAWSWENSL